MGVALSDPVLSIRCPESVRRALIYDLAVKRFAFPSSGSDFCDSVMEATSIIDFSCISLHPKEGEAMTLKIFKSPATKRAEAAAFANNRPAQQARTDHKADLERAPKSFSNLGGLLGRKKAAPGPNDKPVMPKPAGLKGIVKAGDMAKRYAGLDEHARDRNGFGWHETTVSASPVQVTVCQPSHPPKLENFTRVQGYTVATPVPVLLKAINRTDAERKALLNQKFKKAIEDQIAKGVDIDALALKEAEKYANAEKAHMAQYGIVVAAGTAGAVHRAPAPRELDEVGMAARQALLTTGVPVPVPPPRAPSDIDLQTVGQAERNLLMSRGLVPDATDPSGFRMATQQEALGRPAPVPGYRRANAAELQQASDAAKAALTATGIVVPPEPNRAPTEAELDAADTAARTTLTTTGVHSRVAIPAELDAHFHLSVASPEGQAAADKVYAVVDRKLLLSLNGANKLSENVLEDNRRPREVERLINKHFSGSPTDRANLEVAITRIKEQGGLRHDECVALVKVLAGLYEKHATRPTPASAEALLSLNAMPLPPAPVVPAPVVAGGAAGAGGAAVVAPPATNLMNFTFDWEAPAVPPPPAAAAAGVVAPVAPVAPVVVPTVPGAILPTPGATNPAAMALIALNELKDINLLDDIHDPQAKPAGTNAAGWRLALTLNDVPGLGSDMLNKISNQPVRGAAVGRVPLTEFQVGNVSAYLKASQEIMGNAGKLDPGSVYSEAGMASARHHANVAATARAQTAAQAAAQQAVDDAYNQAFADAIANGQPAPPVPPPAPLVPPVAPVTTAWPGENGQSLQLPAGMTLSIPRKALFALRDARHITDPRQNTNGFRGAIPMANGNLITDQMRDADLNLTEFGKCESRTKKTMGGHIDRVRNRKVPEGNWAQRLWQGGSAAVMQTDKSPFYAWDDVLAKKSNVTKTDKTKNALRRVTHTAQSPNGMGVALVHRSGVHEGRSSKRMVEEVENGLTFPYRGLPPYDHNGTMHTLSLVAGQTIPAEVVLHAHESGATGVADLQLPIRAAQVQISRAEREIERAEAALKRPGGRTEANTDALEEARLSLVDAKAEMTTAQGNLTAARSTPPHSLLRDVVRTAMLRAAFAEMNPLPAFTRAVGSSDEEVMTQVKKMVTGMSARQEETFLAAIKAENREFPGVRSDDPLADEPARPHPQRLRQWATELANPAPAPSATNRPLPHTADVTANSRPEEVAARGLAAGEPNWVRFEQEEMRAVHNEIPEGPGRTRRPGSPDQPMDVEEFAGKSRDEIAHMLADILRGQEHSGITLTNGGLMQFNSRSISGITSAFSSLGSLTLRVDAGYGRKRLVTFECGLNMDGAKIRVGKSTLELQKNLVSGGGASFGFDVADVDWAKFGIGGDGAANWEKTFAEGTVFGLPRPDRVAKDDILHGRMADALLLLIGTSGTQADAVNYTQDGIERPCNDEDKASPLKSFYHAFPDGSAGRYTQEQHDFKASGTVSGGFGLTFGKFRLGIPPVSTTGQFIKGKMVYNEHSGPIRVNKEMHTTRFETTVMANAVSLNALFPVGDKNVPDPSGVAGEFVNPVSINAQAASEGAVSARVHQWGNTNTASTIDVNNKETPVSWGINQNHNRGDFANQTAENLPKMGEDRAATKMPSDPDRVTPALKARAAVEEKMMVEFVSERMNVADKAGLMQNLTGWSDQNKFINELKAEVYLANMNGETKRAKQAQKQLDKIHNSLAYQQQGSIRESKVKKITNRVGPNAWFGVTHQNESSASEYSVGFV